LCLEFGPTEQQRFEELAGPAETSDPQAIFRNTGKERY